MKFRRLALVLILAVPQAWGFIHQIQNGYRPFLAAPKRATFSWDMFSTRIERCTLQWQPGIEWRALSSIPLESYRQFSYLLEWDVVYDRSVDYMNLARFSCQFARPSTSVEVRCFFPEGQETHEAFYCS